MRAVMRHWVAVCATALSASLPAAALAQTGCAYADPSSTLAGITGDFELSTDPQDPSNRVLFTSNAIGGPSGANALQYIVLARIDAASGLVIAGSLATIANNYFGDSDLNGPSWMETPLGQLGIIYAGQGGVHGVFRSSSPMAWNDFLYNWDDTPTFGSPSALPDTTGGSYAGNPLNPPQRASVIPQYLGGCSKHSICFGQYNRGVQTDTTLALASYGLTGTYVTQGNTDGWLYASACNVTGACGIYQMKIDGVGGLATLQQIASTGRSAPNTIIAALHPVTGTTILFANGTGNSIGVWQQAAAGGPLTLVGTPTAPADSDHFRVVSSGTQVVLNYFVQAGPSEGSYVLPVNAQGSLLVVGQTKMISKMGAGSEFIWFPAVNRFALYYRTTSSHYVRCWVDVN